MILQDHVKANGNGFAAEKVDSFISLDSEDSNSPQSPVNEPKSDSTFGAETEKYKGNSFWGIRKSYSSFCE